eukprot:Tbor_TRINITY_DN3716_c0_g1::TRINITY_DN3716_c0_g1_i1::g.2340::m.2340
MSDNNSIPQDGKTSGLQHPDLRGSEQQSSVISNPQLNSFHPNTITSDAYQQQYFQQPSSLYQTMLPQQQQQGWGQPPQLQGGYMAPPAAPQGWPPMPPQQPVWPAYQPTTFGAPVVGYQQQQGVSSPFLPLAGGPPIAATPPESQGTELDYFKGFYEGVNRGKGETSSVGTAVSWLVPIFINTAMILGPIWYIRRKYTQQAATAAAKSGGKSSNPMGSMMEMMMPMKPKNYRVEVKGTKFSDVIGIPEAKEDLKQYVDFLKDPAKFKRLGARLPKGCLLTGKPGTGKTLLARAVAGEADKPFFTCSGADFIEVFGGSGPKRVRELFAEARAAAPCVVFIDEIDAIGSRSGGRTMGGGSSEENRTINQLLAELDGLTSDHAIVVVAATNYPEAIDKALLREGRFDRKVNIPMPDKEGRKELFEFYLQRVMTGDPSCKPRIMKMKVREPKDGDNKKSTEKKTDSDKKTEEDSKEEETIPVVVVNGVSNKEYADVLADRTPGCSPAQIATIVNEGALAAAVAEETVVTLPYLQDGIDDVLVGKKHRQRMGDASLRRTAYHECGHAIMAWLNPLQKDVIKVTVVPRGRAGGYTQQVQDEAMEPQTDRFLFSQLCVLLGGRVAERLIMGDISTGALDDLQRATKIALDKNITYGMGGKSQLAFRPSERNDGRAWMNYSEDLHSRAEMESRALIDEAYDITMTTLTANKDKLVELAELLLQKKEIDRADVRRVLGERPVRDPTVVAASSTK